MTLDARYLLFKTTSLTKSYRPREKSEREGKVFDHAIRIGPITVPRGGIIALVGESGTGKTTLFNLLGGLDCPDTPSRGVFARFRARMLSIWSRDSTASNETETPNILLDLGDGPVDVAAFPKSFPRSRVGYVFQSGYLLQNASAGLNLSMPLAQQGRPADRESILKSLKQLKIEQPDEIDEKAWKFSGGEAQRIAFIRSIIHDPDLVFADEPTSNVDYQNAMTVMGLLRAWAWDERYPPRTVLWITHDLRLAAGIADAVMVLHRGCTDPVFPVMLPGDREKDLDKRARVLESWTYNRSTMLADQPKPYVGREAVAPRQMPCVAAGVQLGAVIKAGLSEVFRRHGAQRWGAVRRWVNPTLSVGGALRPEGSFARGLAAWLWSFGQWTSVLAVVLVTLLAAAGFTVYSVVDEHFHRSVNDPRNCHIIIKEQRSRQVGDGGYGDINALSKRPWVPTKEPVPAEAAQPQSVLITEPPPRATCESGPAAYGRIDASGFGIALAREKDCPPEPETYIRLLTAEESEPVWARISLVSALERGNAVTMAQYLDAQMSVQVDNIYLVPSLEKYFGAKSVGDLVGRTVCLYNSESKRPHPLKLRGIVADLPSWDRNDFSGFISDQTYANMRIAMLNNFHETNLLNRSSDIALYFSPDNADALEGFLQREQYGFIPDNLKKIRHLLETSDRFKEIVKVFLGLVGTLLVMLIAMSVLSYLESNARSFALLRAFGMGWRFILGILLVEITTVWLGAIALIFLCVGAWDWSRRDGVWIRFDEVVVASDRIWPSIFMAATAVWVISAVVSLGMTVYWWRRHRYVAQVLKAS